MMSRAVLTFIAGSLACPAMAQQSHDADELARKVSNPAAYMISVPIHAEFDFGSGADGSGQHYLLDIEPVIPFRLAPGWNVISHTDFPFAYYDPAGSNGTVGLGDINQTLSLTPARHEGGLVWAVGIQTSLPTATDEVLGTGKWSMGPSFLLLHQTKSLTLGVSADHLWSVAGKNDRAGVSVTEIEPFAAWHIGGGRTVSTNLDMVYDWKERQWDIPLSISFSQVLKVSGQMISLSIGAKYWLDRRDYGSKWGFKAGVVLLFPQAGR